MSSTPDGIKPTKLQRCPNLLREGKIQTVCLRSISVEVLESGRRAVLSNSYVDPAVARDSLLPCCTRLHVAVPRRSAQVRKGFVTQSVPAVPGEGEQPLAAEAGRAFEVAAGCSHLFRVASLATAQSCCHASKQRFIEKHASPISQALIESIPDQNDLLCFGVCSPHRVTGQPR